VKEKHCSSRTKEWNQNDGDVLGARSPMKQFVTTATVSLLGQEIIDQYLPVINRIPSSGEPHSNTQENSAVGISVCDQKLNIIDESSVGRRKP